MNPRTERALWGMLKENQLVYALIESRDKLAIRNRAMLHYKLSVGHGKVAQICLSDGKTYTAGLHATASTKHAQVVQLLIAYQANGLERKEIEELDALIKRAVEAGTLAVNTTKEDRRRG
jgi:hypothetical protein